MLKIAAISDLHGSTPEIPHCDLLIIAGDLCSGGSFLKQERWIKEIFFPYINTSKAKQVVYIAGNHDTIFQQGSFKAPISDRVHYLEDSKTQILGLNIYGTPWQLPFCGAFNASEIKLKNIYESIPSNLDILITHGPPFGFLDEISIDLQEEESELLYETVHVGSLELRNKILEVKPKIVITGHIHEGFGRCNHQGISFYNVSHVNQNMKRVNPFTTFDWKAPN
jgi:Icc-related predicted phosphoesterase